MGFGLFKKKKEPSLLTPPLGMGRENIRTQSSICTGETLVGFLEPKTNRLLQAVVVRNETDLADYYRSYGYEPPRQN